MSGYFKRMGQLAKSTLAQPPPARTGHVNVPAQPLDPVMPKLAPPPQQDTQQPLKPMQKKTRKTAAPAQKLPGKTSSAALPVKTTPDQTSDDDGAGTDGAGMEAFPVSGHAIILPQLAPSITYAAAAEKQTSSTPPPPLPLPRQVARAHDDPLPRANTLRASEPAATRATPAKKPEKQDTPPARRMKIPTPKPVAAKSADTKTNAASPHPVRPQAIIASTQPAPAGPNEAVTPPAADAMAAITQPPARLLAPEKPPSLEVNIGAISVELGPDSKAPDVIEAPARRPAPKRQRTGIWSGARDLTRNYIRGA